MVIYKNTRTKPICIDTSDGNALSIPSKGKFKVDRNTESMTLFKSYVKKGIFRKISKDICVKEAVKEVVVKEAVKEEKAFSEEIKRKPTFDYPGRLTPVPKDDRLVVSADTQEEDSNSVELESEPREETANKRSSKKKKKAEFIEPKEE